MWVVKIGGSLLQSGSLQNWLEVLARRNTGTNVVVVPGGGVFADQVRSAQARTAFDNRIAHRMAILAMEQFAWLCHGLTPEIIPVSSFVQLVDTHAAGKPAIVLPSRFLEGESGLQQDWSVTSDSIAAWFAERLEAKRLLLVKSCPLDEHLVSPEKLSQAGIVDAMFPCMVRGFAGEFNCWPANRISDFRKLIMNEYTTCQSSCQA